MEIVKANPEGERIMLENSFLEVYDKFKLQFFRKIFELVREQDGALTAMEAFALEVIQILDEPTVSEFADFLNISQSNATYKVNNLIKKGYLERANSKIDRREYHLILSDVHHHLPGADARVRGALIPAQRKPFTFCRTPLMRSACFTMRLQPPFRGAAHGFFVYKRRKRE